MLVYWIPETGNTIPANATHQVSVGALVFNDRREVLPLLLVELHLLIHFAFILFCTF